MKKNRIQGQPRPCTLVSGTPFHTERFFFSAAGVPCRISKGSHFKDGTGLGFCATPAGPGYADTRTQPIRHRNSAGQPLLGPSMGKHKTLIYNI